MKKKIKKAKKYQITLTENQINYVSMALEAYARLGIGQVDLVLRDIFMLFKYNKDRNVYTDQINMAFETIKREIFDLDSGSSYGIGNKNNHDAFQSCWDMHQVIRNKLSWENHPEGGMGVNFDVPMKMSKEPLMEIKNMEEKNDQK